MRCECRDGLGPSAARVFIVPEQYYRGPGGEGAPRKVGGVNKNSLTRLRTVREGFAWGRLSMIHSSRVRIDCLSGVNQYLIIGITKKEDDVPALFAEFDEMYDPSSPKYRCRAARTTPTLMSFPDSQATHTL